MLHAPNGGWKYDSADHWEVCYCGTIINKAAHNDENEDGICDVCEYDMSDSEVFHILEGANAIWSDGSEDPVVMRSDGALKEFQELDVDEQTLSSSDYDVAEGSTIVSIHPEFLSTLEDGDHTVSFVYSHGSVSTQLSVIGKDAKALDATDDSLFKKTNILIGILFAVTLLLIIGIIILAVKLRRAR